MEKVGNRCFCVPEGCEGDPNYIPERSIFVSGSVSDTLGIPVPNTTIITTWQRSSLPGTLIGETLTDTNGDYNLRISWNKCYIFYAFPEKQGYQESEEITVNPTPNRLQHTVHQPELYSGPHGIAHH